MTARRGVALCCGCVLLVAVGYAVLGWSVRASAAETLEQAEQFLRRRDNAAARESLKWLLWFEPTHHEALLIAGVSLNADRRFSEAVDVLQRVPPDSASAEQAGIAMAASLVSDGQLDRAESVLQGHLDRFPQSASARDRLVRLYANQLRIRDAAAVLTSYHRRHPGDLSVLPYLLDLEARPATPQEGLESLEAADKAHPDQPSVVLALAHAYSLMGLTQAARERFQRALQLRPNDPTTRILAAEFHLDCGEVAAAADLVLGGPDSNVIGLVDDDRYWFLRCRICERESDVEAADRHLQKAVAIRPMDETYLLMQATLLRRMGRADQANRAAQQAAQLADARKRLFMLSHELNRDQPSRAHCLEIAELLDRLGRADQSAAWRRVGAAATRPNPG